MKAPRRTPRKLIQPVDLRTPAPPPDDRPARKGRKRGKGEDTPLARHHLMGSNVGSDYTDEEREFLVAVERWKRETGCQFPALRDYLAIMKGLGWRKVADTTASEDTQ